MDNETTKQKIAIITTCPETWGGSEELWAKSIWHFQNKGFETVLYKNKIDMAHPNFAALRQNGTQLVELYTKARYKRIAKWLWKKVKNKINKEKTVKDPFQIKLEMMRPAFVIVCQAINFDGLGYGSICYKLNIPYAIVCQKAVDFYWPNYYDRAYMIDSLKNATGCFFVCQHNKKLTEEQFGIPLPNSKIVFNPVKFNRVPHTFPTVRNGYKLACIARLFLLDKGQDMLIRILSKPKWKDRPISVSFVGKGVDLEGLQDMANFLGVDRVSFLGHIDDVSKIWETHHALILPSRSEGMPLVLLEAMAIGRPAIITNAGGNAEIVAHGETGFVGQVSEEGFEDAMESAWAMRANWEQMGIEASKSINQKVPANPEMEFSNAILKLIHAK